MRILSSVVAVGVCARTMIITIFFSDFAKVFRGAYQVTGSAINIQSLKLKLFTELITFGSNNKPPLLAAYRPGINTQRCVLNSQVQFPDFCIKRRNYSASVTDAPGGSVATNQKKKSPAKQRHVPSSRLGRAAGFGNLFVGLGIGAATEYAKRTLGGSDDKATSSVFLSDDNLERIVDTLCRMRGAALKLGQMLSIQDSSMVSPKVQKIFERVRQSADFMPTKQMYKVVDSELGPDWRDKLGSFDETPFAAASIGQVHMATLPDGRRLAMKVQYPGVAKSIETDVANITMLLRRFNFLPRGMYADAAIETAKRELKWECDYYREAAFAAKFALLLADEPAFAVPMVFQEFSTQRVYTTEFFDGLVLDECVGLPQETRNWIGENLLRLCLLETFVFNCMQTDPNWSNFLYSKELNKIILLDFGASRDYPRPFVDDYLRVIVAAANRDYAGIIQFSHRLGFLTGYESKMFLDAHAEAVQILGEPFATEGPFDFGQQSTTKRINSIIPVMLEHRLTPPPPETYSLHRKLSGCFLLCGKLKAVIDCRKLFLPIAKSYVFGLPYTPTPPSGVLSA